MDKLVKWLENLLRAQKKSRAWRTFVSCLAAIVVFTTTYSLILPAITVEQSATEDVGGLVLDEADPGSTGAEAEASGEVVTVDADNETTGETSDENPDEVVQEEAPAAEEEAAQTAPTEETASENKTTQSAASQTETAQTSESKAAVAEEVREPVNGEVQTIGDKRVMTLKGDDFDVVVSGDLSVGVSDRTVLSVRGIADADVVKSFSDRISDELLKIFVDKKTTEVLYQLVFTDENLVEYAPAGYFDVQFIFHNNTVSHTGEMVYAAIYDYLTDEMILAEKNGDEYGTPVISMDEYGIIKGITLKGMHFDEYSDIITLVAGPVNEELKLAAEKAAEAAASESKAENAESADSKTESTEKTDSTEKTESADAKTDSAESKAEGPSAKAETSKNNENESGTLTARGTDYTVTLSYGADAKIPAGASLEVSEIENGTRAYKKYLAQAKAAMGLDKNQELPKEQARFFDIKIMADGKEVQPSANVSVNITYDQPVVEAAPNVEAQVDASAVHFRKEGAEVVAVNDVDASRVEFEAESFSVYGVIYTVDFEYTDPTTGGTYQYSLNGGESINLTELLVLLGIKSKDEVEKFVAEEVENVEFSNSELVRVTHNGKFLGLFGKEDWKLESLKPFDTEETLAISLRNGEKIVINVTDDNTYSGDLKNFVTSVDIDADLEGTVYVIKPGKKYTASIHFAEDPDGYQFNEDGKFTYSLPNGFTPDDVSGEFTIVAMSKGVEYPVDGNKYSITGNTLTVELNTESPNYQYVSNSALTEFNLNIDGEFNESIKKYDWGGGVTTDIRIDNDAGVSVEKTITRFDESTGTLHYQLKIKSVNGPSENIKVTDAMSGTVVALQQNVTLSGASMSQDGVTYKTLGYGPDTVNGFEFTIPHMDKDQEAIVTYTAVLDKDKFKDYGYNLDHEGKNSVNVVPDEPGKPDSDNTDLKHTITPPSLSKASSVSDIVDGKRTITWTIEATSTNLYSLAGSPITDSITNDPNGIMKYSGPGIKIVVTDENGDTDERNVLWSNVGVNNFETDKAWKYNVPTTDTGNRKYVITYTTEVDCSDLISDFELKNTVEDKNKKTEGTGKVGPEGETEKTTLDKKTEDVTLDKVSWSINFDVPVQGLKSAIVVDELPHAENTYRDELIGDIDEVVIVGLIEGQEKAERQYSYNAEKKCYEAKFVFKKLVDGNWVDGLLGGDSKRPIKITIQTKNDQNWITAAEQLTYLREHRNNVSLTANGYVLTDSEPATPMKSTFKKSIWTDPPGPNSINVDGVDLPRYNYQIVVSGVTGAFDITDTFDSRFTLVEDSVALYGGDQYYQGYEGSNKVVACDESQGTIVFNISDDNLAKQGSAYYPFYKLVYSLRVKDAAALKSLQADAAKSDGGKKVLNNKAVSVLGEDDEDVTFEYKSLNKELVNSDDVGKTTNICKFRITVNPEGFDLDPDSDTVTLTDAYSDTLSIDYKTIKVEPSDGATWNVTASSGQNIATFVLPDETPLVITYDARIIGNGKIKFNNVATIRGQKSEINDERTVRANMGGTAQNYGVVILKHKQNDMTETYEGAEFELYNADGTPVKDKDQNVVKFITNSDGMAYVEGSQSDDGWSILPDHEYYLWEVKAPEGTVLPEESVRVKYRFTVASNDIANYKQFIYHRGDTLKIDNKPLGGIELRKSFIGAPLSDDEKAKIVFTVTGPNGYEKKVSLSDFKDGKSFKISGLPAGEYTVVESNADVGGYIRSTSYYVDSGSTTEGESATVNLSDATVEKVVSFVNKYQSEVEINPDDTQLRVQKKWYQGNEDKTNSGDYDNQSVEVQVERYRAVMPTTTVHFVDVDGKNEIPDSVRVSRGADVSISIQNTTNICAKNTASGMWNSDGRINGEPFYGNTYSFSTGSYSDVYVHFQNNPGKISVTSSGGNASVSDTDFSKDGTYTGPTATLTSENWSKTFYNLPTTGEDGTNKYIYKYLVKEITEINGFKTTYQVDGGVFKDTLSIKDAIGEKGYHSVVIKNTTEKTEFEFTKIWTTSGKSGQDSWHEGKTISVTLKRKLIPNGSTAESSEYDPNFSETYILKSNGVDASDTDTHEDYPIAVEVNDKDYKFTISNLESAGKMKIEGTETSGTWKYFISEQQDESYNPVIYFDSGSTTENHGSEVGTGGKIQNDLITVSLPSTGGPGTRFYYSLGIAFIAMAGIILFIKRKEMRSLRGEVVIPGDED